MRTIQIFFFLFFIIFFSNAQNTKTIIITKSPKIVPANKKWVLEAGKVTRVQVSYGVLSSGSLCNALFLSNPNMISTVYHGDIFNAEGYMLFFKDPEEVPYTNSYTFDFTVQSIVDKNFSINDLNNKSAEEVGFKLLEVKAGESVFVGNCLVSIEFKEINMTQTEISEIKRNEDAITKANLLKLQNFNIPINPEKYVEPGIKPVNHDFKLKSIIFSSSSVLHKRPGKGYAVDDVSIWTMTLNIEEFSLQSSNGIDKIYKVIKIEYDDKMKMQQFTLGNSDNEITHILQISWLNSANEYTLLLSSIDNNEEYQFQNVQSTDKQYQTK
jgi:hypothetical protein